jgi:hypothetical protein
MHKVLLLIWLFALPAVLLFTAPALGADTPCVPGVVAGMNNATAICNVRFDTTNPSGETYARTIGVIFYPTSLGAGNATSPIVIWGGGCGWGGENQIPYWRLLGYNPALLQDLIDAGFVVYGPYPTWAASSQLTSASNVGNSSLSIYASGISYWPDDPICMGLPTPPCGYTYPYTIVVDGGTANQETAVVTSRTGAAHPFTINLAAPLTKPHAVNATVDVPVTQWPAQLNDRKSLLSWIAANAGKGTYPGNPLDIRHLVTSSDSQVGLMSVFTPKTGYLTSCPSGSSWWGDSLGPSCGSSNTSTAYGYGPFVGVSVPLDLSWMYTNAWDGGAGFAIRIVLGCRPGIDAGCDAFASTASPSSVASHLLAPLVYLQVGTADGTTPVCAQTQTWPDCPGNQYAGFQSAYDPLETSYEVFVGEGHGLGGCADCRAKQEAYLMLDVKIGNILRVVKDGGNPSLSWDGYPGAALVHYYDVYRRDQVDPGTQTPLLQVTGQQWTDGTAVEPLYFYQVRVAGD